MNAKKHTLLLFECESDFMARPGIFQNSNNTRLRDSAISRIIQLTEIPEIVCDVTVQVLATTYFDRCFDSLPHSGDQDLDTFIIACIVLAGKWVDKFIRIFPMQIFLEKNGLVNERANIENMECWIRDMLGQKMDSITPLSFTDFFLSLIYDNDPDQLENAKANGRFCENILFMHGDAEFVQFKPSIIAAVAIVAEEAKNGLGDFCDPILRCKHVNTDEFEKCSDLLKSRPKPPPPPPAPTQQ